MPSSRREPIESKSVLSDFTELLGDITVGIPTCDDDPDILALALDAILAEPLEQPPIVVDMSRGEGVSEVVAARPRIRYVRYRESAGVSDSRNRVVELTPTRYLLFIDADAIPDAGWARVMRGGFERDVAVVGARACPCSRGRAAPFHQPDGSRPDRHVRPGDQAQHVPRIMGTSYALDLELLSPQPFSLAWGRGPGTFEAGEEVILCEAARAAGWSVRYEPGAVVHHHLRPERASWRWMLRRARIAGREARRAGRRPEPLPRRFGVRDYAFLAAVAPAYFAGRLGA
jgi:GT2 family glycosyltransferase